MDELPAHAKAVLRRAQNHDQCHDDDARRRVREGVSRAVGVAVGTSSVDSSLARPTARFDLSRVAAQPLAPAAKSAPLLALVGKLTVTAAVVVALAGLGVALRRRSAEQLEQGGTRASAVVSAPPVMVASPSSSPPRKSVRVELPAKTQGARPSGSGVAEARRHAGRSSRAAFLTARAPMPETLDAEVVMLRLLEEAVSRRDTREAERLLMQHRARFAQPVLLEERQGFSALVGCMEHGGRGLAAARTFVARYPNSVLTPRVLRECEPEGR
jgi:hypothetical protein